MPKNIKASFAASGLFSFNLNGVVRSTPNPPAEPAIPRTDEVRVGSYRQDVELQTPVAPVSVEALMSLQNLIIQRDAHALDETSKQNLARHLQEICQSFLKILCQGYPPGGPNSTLSTINNEAKVRRSAKSLVLGKAKVTSYEDLEEARAKHERSVLKRVYLRNQRPEKTWSEAQEAPEPSNKVARVSKVPAPATASVVQMSGTPVAKDEIVPEL